MIRTNAIIIRTADYSETDRMITLLTKDLGLLSAKVKAAKKQTSKLFCSSSLFCCGEYELYEKSGFYGVRGCNITHSFQKLSEDYDSYSVACFIADAAGKIAQEGFAEPKLYALVVNALYTLETKSASPGTVLCYFIQRLLYIEGLYPSPDSCAICGDVAVSRFSAENGGFICEKCAGACGGTWIDKEAVEALRGMSDIVPKDICKVRLTERAEEGLKKLLIAFLENTLQKPLKSSKFISGN
jgi:DNA repair protein RecO (recombination protein O)